MINLIPVSNEDQSFLLSLFLELKTDEFQFITEEQRIPLLNQQFIIQHQGYNSKYPQHEHFIVTLHNQKIGQVRINYGEHTIQLIDISIQKQFQSKGIGTSIINQLQQEANDCLKSISLFVINTNLSAKRLYEWLGFQIVEEREPYIFMKWHNLVN